ncbi:hypothetical protein C8J57DRAFT_1094086 [Mycena rebaudengoi]|nr:hypothetical protein C8J57DRAFT_1094086 [Mycena rebaudengoi]
MAKTKPASNLPKTPVKPKGPLSPYHPSRLIVTLRDIPSGAGPLSERDAVKVINQRLHENDESKHLVVTAVKYNAKSNCIVFTRDGQTAAELKNHEDKFLRDLACGGQATARLDTPWYKVQIHGVYTGVRDGQVLTAQEIWDELCWNNPVLGTMALLHLPRWMRSETDIQRQQLVSSSVVVAFEKEEDAAALLEQRSVVAFARFCDVRRHTDKPPVRQCNRCWDFGHHGPQCKGNLTCRLCGGNHEEENHPLPGPVEGEASPTDVDMEGRAAETIALKCARCGGDHAANDRRCPARARYMGVMREREETRKKKGGGGRGAAGDGGWKEVGRGARAEQTPTQTAPTLATGPMHSGH